MGYKRTIFISGNRLRFIYTLFFLTVIFLLLISFSKLILRTVIQAHCPTVVIDAGHGGIDGGAVRGDVMEKDINLSISLMVQSYLEQNDMNVIMTRSEDISLEKLVNNGDSRHSRDLKARAQIINHSHAQIFTSIHVNSNVNNPSASGSYVFYNETRSGSQKLAYMIQRQLNSMYISDKKRTIHDPQKGNYYLLVNGKIPGVIVETAFLSNQEEFGLLKTSEYHQALAQAIANGICEYFEEIRRVYNVQIAPESVK